MKSTLLLLLGLSRFSTVCRYTDVCNNKQVLTRVLQQATRSVSARDDYVGQIDPMFQLTDDTDFHFELLRDMGLAPYEGSDIGEMLMATEAISKSVRLIGNNTVGDMGVFSETFSNLANHVHSQAKAIDPKSHPTSARNAYFRAATYYRSADFYLHGNWSDPRINSLWKQHRQAFDAALQLMDLPGERVTLESKDGSFQIPAIFYSNGRARASPTIIVGNGYDGAQEELYHVFGKAALERGYNVITYEGPGQPTVRREQNLGFIPDWERAVSPVLDYAQSLQQVDSKSIAIVGYSLGGYLAARAAAFDDRIAAVIAIDGVYDFYNDTVSHLPQLMLELFNNGNKTAFNDIMDQQHPTLPTTEKWAMDQGLWSFKIDNVYDYYNALRQYTLKGLGKQIKVPVFVGNAEIDEFFLGQPEQMAKFLGDQATLYSFNTTDAAHLHCSVGASVYLNQVVYDWLEQVFNK